MLFGVIGGTGWLAACSALVQKGAWSSLPNVFGRADGYVVLVFYAVSAAGLVLAVKALKEKTP